MCLVICSFFNSVSFGIFYCWYFRKRSTLRTNWVLVTNAFLAVWTYFHVISLKTSDGCKSTEWPWSVYLYVLLWKESANIQLEVTYSHWYLQWRFVLAGKWKSKFWKEKKKKLLPHTFAEIKPKKKNFASDHQTVYRILRGWRRDPPWRARCCP